MSHIEIPYDNLRQKAIHEIEKHQFVVLATTDGEKVSARTIIRISNELTLYCMTGEYTRKYKQVLKNPNVAIAEGNLQIEGKAKPLGHPLDTNNSAFVEAYSKQHPKQYERSTKIHFKRPNVGVLEIKPTRITLYNLADLRTGAEAYLEILDVDKKEAFKISRSPAGYDTPKYV
jgi:general stress protein 26